MGFPRLFAPLLLFAIAMPVWAQQVSLTLQQPPPNRLNAENLWAIQAINNTGAPLQIVLVGTVTEERRGQVITARSAPITLQPGIRRITSNDVKPAQVNLLQPDLRAIMTRTNTLPSGSYEACVVAIAIANEREVASTCIHHEILNATPPLLVEPSDGATLEEPRPRFAWLPPAPAPTGVRYQIRIVEVLGRQSAEAAFAANPPWFVGDARSTFFALPVSSRTLTPGATYAWRVAASFEGSTEEMLSEVWSFTIGAATSGSAPRSITITSPKAPCGPNVSLTETQERTLQVEFEATGVFNTFVVTVNRNPCGKVPAIPVITAGPTLSTTERTTESGRATTSVSGSVNTMRSANTPIVDVSRAIPATGARGSTQRYTHNVDVGSLLQPGEACVIQVVGSYVGDDGTSGSVASDMICPRYRPIDETTQYPVPTLPCPKEVVCEMIIEEKVEPKMDGGLDPPKEDMVIPRDQFVPLKAIGGDVDQLWWYCMPKKPCPETPSTEMTLLSSRVRFTWKIIKGEGAFVKLGCLPTLTATTGDQVIFEPPFVLIGEAKETKIELAIIDDNPSQPSDATVKRIITIKTRRPVEDSTHHWISVESTAGKPPTGTSITGLPKGSCKATGPKWSGTKELVKPVVVLPPVPSNDTLAFGEWIVLEATDNRDPDVVSMSCISDCTPSLKSRTYEDEVQWKWTIVKGTGSFPRGSIGRFVIFSASTVEGDVELEAEVYNPSGLQIADAVPERGKVKLVVVRPGIAVDSIPRAWRPAFDVTLTVTARMKVKAGGIWRDPLAHMCRIVDFSLQDVSNEPGIALNADDTIRPRRENLDLRFRREDNLTFVLSRAPVVLVGVRYFQHAETERKIVGSQTASPVVFCEDWGAYGKIKAEARDYDTVTPNPRAIPLDDNANHIADGQTAWDAAGVAGITDVDATPSENPTKGDGFSNYEEYRGFYDRARAHITPDPAHKNLFIVDGAGYGLGSFANSGIVSYFIDRTQMDADRVVNFKNRTHHAGDQHGLITVAHAFADGTRGEAIGGPGLPLVVTEVRINSALGAGAMRNRVIAHELTHGCNVFHHGETSETVNFRLAAGSCAEFTIVTAGGLTSGVQGCYMRYSWSDYYCDVAAGGLLATETDPAPGCAVIGGRRVVAEPDGVIGADLCNATAGTGVNAGPRCGGNATVGECQKKLRVKDF